MSLNPRISKDASGVYWLDFDPDPTAEGYAFQTPGGPSRQFSQRHPIKIGKPATPFTATVTALDILARQAEAASYPPALFGAELLAAYPPLPDPPGPVIELATFAEFKAAWEKPVIGADYTCKGRTFTGDGKEVVNPSRGSVTTRYRHGTVINAQLNTQALNILLGRTMAEPIVLLGDTPQGLKIDHDSADISCDGLIVKTSTGQGILIGSGSAPAVKRIRLVNFITSHDGSNTSLDHGLYAAHVDGFLFANWLSYGNQAYMAQIYPQALNGLIVHAIWDGGTTRGGAIYGTEPSDAEPTKNVRTLACISTNAPNAAGYNVQNAAPGCVVEDSIAFGNSGGDISSKLGQKNLLHADPMYVSRAAEDFHLQPGSPARGIVDPANYGWLLPTDLDGKPRAGTAGCYA